MTCAECAILLHALLDGELDAREVETHLETCPRCAAQLRAYRELQQSHAGRAAVLYGADGPAPAHRDRAAGGAPAHLEPPALWFDADKIADAKRRHRTISRSIRCSRVISHL